MGRFALSLVALTTVALTVGSVSAAKQSDRTFTYRTFKTPTGNILCGIFLATAKQSTLRCDINSGLKPRVKRPKGCDYDFGGTLELRGRGRAYVGCVSDAVGQPTRVLGYGQTLHRGPFTCVSKKTGLTCRNRSGHGFFLSKQRWRRI